jgi:hypothetical protein
MQLKLTKTELNSQLKNGGLEISIEGLVGDPTSPIKLNLDAPLSDDNSEYEVTGISVFIEHYEGKVLCHIWTGGAQDCQTIELT